MISALIVAMIPILCFSQSSNVSKESYDVVEIAVEAESQQDNAVILDIDEEAIINARVTCMQEKIDLLSTIPDKKERYIEYKNIVNEYSDVFDPPESIYDIYTEDEILLIQKVVETECYGCGFDEKCNVASVIFNRIESEVFDDSVESVVFSPNQFAHGRSDISEDTILAVEYAFQIEDTTDGCIAFHSNAKTSTFNGWVYCFTDNAGHHFYKIGG